MLRVRVASGPGVGDGSFFIPVPPEGQLNLGIIAWDTTNPLVVQRGVASLPASLFGSALPTDASGGGQFSYRKFDFPVEGEFWFLSGLVQQAITPAELQARVDESIDLMADAKILWQAQVFYPTPDILEFVGTSTFADGAGALPTVTLGGVNTGVSYLWIRYPVGGVRGVATWEWSITPTQDPTLRVWTAGGVTAAGPLAIGATGATVSFGAGTYATDMLYRSCPRESDYMEAFAAYMASSKKARLKFCWILQQNWAVGSGVNFASYTDYWISTFADPQYLKVDTNRPVIFLFGGESGTPQSWVGSEAYIEELRQATIAAGYGQPYYVSMGMDSANALALQTDATTSYGPLTVIPPDGAVGHLPWQDQLLSDQACWAQFTYAQTVLQFTPVAARIVAPPNYTVDQPVFSQWKRHLQSAASFAKTFPFRIKERLCLIYAKNELGEGGPFMPTLQEGNKFLEAVRQVQEMEAASYNWDRYPSDNLIVVASPAAANWPQSTSLVGAWDYQERINLGTTAGHYIELTPVFSAPFSNCRRLQVYGTKGDNRGICEILLDGMSQGTVDLYAPNAPAAGRHQLIFDTGVIAAGSHTLRVVATNTKNAASSAFFVGVDSFFAEVLS